MLRVSMQSGMAAGLFQDILVRRADAFMKFIRALLCFVGLIPYFPAYASEGLVCNAAQNEVERELDQYYKNVMMPSIRDRLIKDFRVCIKVYPVCMGGYQDRQGKFSAAVWHATALDAPITPKFLEAWSSEAKRYKVDHDPNIPGVSDASDGDGLYVVLLQVPKALNGQAACIYAFNVRASVAPWGMYAWRIKKGLAEKVKLQGIYAPPFNGHKGGSFSTDMEPYGLRTLMLDIYDYEVVRVKQ